MTKNYDYIIAGSGLAGLSLLYNILSDNALKYKRILVIDKIQKAENDRTWCFWEKDEGIFEPIVYHQWRTLQFFSNDVSKRFELKKYSYKMIRAIDFYKHVMEYASKFDNIIFKIDSIEKIYCEEEQAIVKTKDATYVSEYVFNSTNLFHPLMNTENSLLQHFTGWYVQTEAPVFNDMIGTLMDFRLSQEYGATFMYVLPTSSTEALIEYTLFSEKILKKEQYHKELRAYMNEKLKVEHYDVIHDEFGVIPMSLAKFKRFGKHENRIINIGTAGGFTKASTGYTFQFVQKNVKQIVDNLKVNKSPAIRLTLQDKIYHWYDRTLLDVLLEKKLTGEEIFSHLFKNNPPETILSFLANESTFWQEFKIRNSVPIIPFMISGIKQFLK